MELGTSFFNSYWFNMFLYRLHRVFLQCLGMVLLFFFLEEGGLGLFLYA